MLIILLGFGRIMQNGVLDSLGSDVLDWIVIMPPAGVAEYTYCRPILTGMQHFLQILHPVFYDLPERPVREFLELLATLRWDDHRYYHQSRINQTLHLLSAISFLVAYGLLFVNPAGAALVGWLVGMVTRQSGHLFFEPRGYDRVNNTTYSHKESIKVGYNMRRKGILIAIWLACPLVLAVQPDWRAGPDRGVEGYLHTLGLLWLALGACGLAARTIHLTFLRGPRCALAWATKILTDPFHNIAQYWRSPIALMHGELLDPIAGAH